MSSYKKGMMINSKNNIIDWNNLKIASTCHKNLDINKTQKYTQTKQKAMVSYCQILTEVVA